MKPSLRPLLVPLALWGLAAGLAGSVHLLAHLPPFAAPILITGLTIFLARAAVRRPAMRAAIDHLGLRTLLTVHVGRFVGLYFLWLHAQGRLPAEFAHRAGWGDVIAAAGALILLLLPEGAGFRRAVWAWNVVGVADLLLAVGTAGWLTFVRPGSMFEISGLPLALVPLFAVPVLLVSHLVIFRRVGRPCADMGAGAVPQGS